MDTHGMIEIHRDIQKKHSQNLLSNEVEDNVKKPMNFFMISLAVTG